MRKGIAVSPGVAIGSAYCINQIFVNPVTQRIADTEITAELARYETARDRAAAELRALQKKVATQVGPDEAAIFAGHESILRDPAFTDKIRGWIVDQKMASPAALDRLLNEYTVIFSQNDDPYLRERLNDIRDVVIRLSAHVSDVLKPELPAIDGPLIVVADELLPSQAVALVDADVRGIVTQAGSQTSHAAIIARSRGIPAISGLRGVLRQVANGDCLVVDGREGHLITKPDPETLSAFKKLEREFFDLQNQLAENRDQPSRAKCGEHLQLLGNINSVSDAKSAVAMGADGVGLFRTEYLYLTHPNVPDEEEQLEVYRDIIAASPGRQITIRTLDIGGDKTVPYMGHTHKEANPFLGWRSIRLSFEHPAFFNTQIRAVLRAAGEVKQSHGDCDVRLMFPMITTLEELRKVRSMVRRVSRALKEEGKCYADVQLGMMVEVPAAAVMIDSMLEVADFVSIGSNDLVQYLMAADRDNPKVNHLCQPLSPPVLRVLHNVIQACNRAGKRVTLCGEMAGRPRAFVLLLGMGLRNFSMSPSFIPSIKELACNLDVATAEAIFQQALTYKRTVDVKRFMHEKIAQLAPGMALLDTA